jgi:hypothetical protein
LETFVSATEARSARNKNGLANTSSPWRGRFAVALLFASVGLSFAQVPPAPPEERNRAANVAAGSSLTVVVPGGKMTFPDGTSAETTTRDLEPLKPGSRYVLFLESNDKGGQAEYVAPEARGGYRLKLGSQGVFELGANTVKAQGRQIDLVKQQNNGISPETFLAKLRKAREVAGKPAR